MVTGLVYGRMKKFTSGLWLVSTALVLQGCGSSTADKGTMTESSSEDKIAIQEATSSTGKAAADAGAGQARRGDVTDNYHGTVVADPYRWLEDPDSPETQAWVAAQNKATAKYFEDVPNDDLVKKLTKVWNYERYGIPQKKGRRYFFSKNNGLQNQSIVYWSESPDDDGKILLDPNKLSKDGTVALAGYTISDDGKYLAYGVQNAGSDWSEWRVRDVSTGDDLPERIKWVKFSAAYWNHDNTGFYYGRYPEPTSESELTGQNFNQKLYFHELRKKQSEDQVVYARPDKKKWYFAPEITEDGKYLLVSVSKGTGEDTLVYFADLSKKPAASPFKHGDLTPLVTEWKASYNFIGNKGANFYFTTNSEAPRGRVVSVNVKKKKPIWRSVVPQNKSTLQGVNWVGGRLIATYLKDAKSEITVYSTSGKKIRNVELPGIGTAGGFRGKQGDNETYYAFTSFIVPPSIYRYDVKTGKSKILRQAKVDFDPSKYEVNQVFYQSKDKTKVPMFLVHKKGLVKDGSNPTLLYGYGGFNIPLTPAFSSARTVWLDMGGLLAIPNLRGGGEYGEEWHQAGTKLRKQNVFDDFITAAEWLIAQKYTSPKKLAISGRSNGGLLVGATMTQRPDLFAAALPAVGVLDMLRFHKFTIGWAWVDDYGSSDDPAEFEALYAYSPYHNVKPGTEYPATLVLTADHDDRVVPGHSFKFAAALQHAQKGANPILARIETRAGHGAGKPTWMQIEDVAVQYGFLRKVLDIK